MVRTRDVDNVPAGGLGTSPEAAEQAPGTGPGRRPSAAAGEWPDVAVIYRQHHADLVRLALLLVGDRASAEDVVQDVFTRLCTRDRVLARDSALAYVRTAARMGGGLLVSRTWPQRRHAEPGREAEAADPADSGS